MQAKASGLPSGKAPWQGLRAHLASTPLPAWVACALWPVWSYLWQAYTAPGADPAPGLVLLAALGYAAWIARSARDLTAPGEGPPPAAPVLMTGALALYAGTYPWAPPLARALFGLSALGLSLRALPGVSKRGGWGLASLVVLAAPAIDTLGFFLGGPLRSAAAEVAVWTLAALGNTARATGGDSAFWVNGRLFSMDAPCSGINGLWSGLVLAAALAAWRRLELPHTGLLLSMSVLLCVPANGWRAATLVYLEVLTPRFAPFAGDPAHALIGLVVFGCTTGLLLILSGLLVKEPCPALSNGVKGRMGAWKYPDTGRLPFSPSSVLPFHLTFRHAAVLLAAAVIPLAPRPAPAVSARQPFTGWPREWMGQPLRPLPASEMDRRWAALAPGPLARFALPDGSELLLRWVDRPTRALHPPEDCYRGLGAVLTPQSPVRASAPGTPEPVLWRRFLVAREGRSWEVRSLIRSESGTTYSDPAWWWWRVAGPGARDRGPWWAITLQTPL